MREQFLGKVYWWTLGVIAIAHVVAFFALHTPVEAVITCVAIAAVFGLAIWKLELGLLIAFAELFVGSHGHLFSADWFSLRMAIFVAVMAAWLIRVMLKKTKINLADSKLFPFYLLAIAVLLGGAVGIVNGNEKLDVFNDLNAYFYLLYLLPMLSIEWDSLKKRQLLQVLAASTKWIVLETLALVYLFSHASEGLERILYTFFRDARVAEVTHVSGNVFRIFMQSQFTAIVFILLITAALFFLWSDKKNRFMIISALVGLWSVIVISLSRSFWVGLAVGLLIIGLVLVKMMKLHMYKFRDAVVRSVLLVSSVVVGVGLLWGLMAVPFPQTVGAGAFGSILSSRATELDEAAARSRWQLLEPMWNKIVESPIAGNGFGTVVEYESDDPRVQNLQGGVATTYAFEWGYLDLWLKLGILGLIAFIWIFVFYFKALMAAVQDFKWYWIAAGFLAGLVALFVTHIFSPYLNHPIGLGFLVFLVPFLKTKDPSKVLESVKKKVEAAKPAVKATPAITSKILE